MQILLVFLGRTDTERPSDWLLRRSPIARYRTNDTSATRSEKNESESAGGESFDGTSETAVFPGDLPEDPSRLFDATGAGFRGLSASQAGDADYRFLHFRPPPREPWGGRLPTLPHIRLDRALQFLLGDRLR